MTMKQSFSIWIGIAEFDDVFGNTLGGWIGVVVAWTWVKNKAMRTTRWKI